MGLFGTLFGKSAKSTSKSWNEAAPWINETFQPAAQAGVGGINALAGFLGNSYDDYLKNTGFNFGMNEGMGGIVEGAAARGLLNSGPTQKALVRYGEDYARTAGAGQYQNALATLGGLGLGAGGVVAGANQRSAGTSTGGTDGAIGKIGQLASAVAMFSDRRLKTDIEKIGEEPDGLGVYRFRYLWEDGAREGVMADEVAELRPWALGPVVDGYSTVVYEAL
jgi:hypothetical protein